LAYVFGVILAWWRMHHLVLRPPSAASQEAVGDFITWAILGVVIGGRFGYVLFYNFPYYMDDPLAALRVWEGGMSFHGGFLGVVVAGLLFVRKRKIALLPFADIVCCSAPIGLFLGRIANFINGELLGRITDVPWAMVFPRGGSLARHPSQLYEAALEGVVLFILLSVLHRNEAIRRRPGFISGVFLVGYSAARGVVELFRQPDAHLGFFLGGSTMGQWLSLPMAMVGLFLIFRAKKVSSEQQK
jgi:phosphatidylglycerol---prolipoprotein diacylglyceryl transferase